MFVRLFIEREGGRERNIYVYCSRAIFQYSISRPQGFIRRDGLLLVARGPEKGVLVG